MSVPPLRTLCLCVGISPLTPSTGGLSAVGCGLPLPLSASPATFTRSVKHKSYICNAYKKHGGVGEYVPLSVSRSPRPTCSAHSNACNLNRFMRLLHGSLDTPGVCPSPSPRKFRLQPSTFSFQVSIPANPPRLTSRGTRVTDHGSRITLP